MRATWMRLGIILAMTWSILPGAVSPTPGSHSDAVDPLADELAAAFQIDISEIRVAFDYWPETARVRGTALLTFRMRPHQHRALFHFNPHHQLGPAAEQRSLRSLELDGRALDPTDRHDVRRIHPGPSAETAFEINRRLSPGVSHRLRVRWETRAPRARRGWFFAPFDDTEGPDAETETLWPTVSSPEEFARHRIRIRVHSDHRYTVLGSGDVSRIGRRGQQTWTVDTGVPVASHTVFLAALPAAEFDSTRLRVGDVEVRIASNRGKAAVRKAASITRRAIRQLVRELGPFPMPRMQVMLTGWGSGMEYYGATRTGMGSLEHELGHMYFGATTVNRTWRDTWFDESAVVWWEDRNSIRPVGPRFSSSLARHRSPVEPGFDVSAYGAGARVLATVADALGGEDEMLEFLADLHHRRRFEPFSTDELIDDVVAAQHDITRADLERWLYGRTSDAPSLR